MQPNNLAAARPADWPAAPAKAMPLGSKCMGGLIKLFTTQAAMAQKIAVSWLSAHSTP